MVRAGKDLKAHLILTPGMDKDTFHYPRFFQAPSNLASDTLRDGAATGIGAKQKPNEDCSLLLGDLAALGSCWRLSGVNAELGGPVGIKLVPPCWDKHHIGCSSCCDSISSWRQLALPCGGHTCGISQACRAVPRLLSWGFIKRSCGSFLCSFPGFGPDSPPSTALVMDALNVSIAFFFLVGGMCQALRWLSKRLLSPRAYGCLAREVAGSLQLCTSCLELRMLMDIGPWGGGFGLDVILTLLFLLFAVHGASFDGASANPTVSVQEFLLLESSLAATAAKLLAQGVGTGTGWAVTKLFWSWELTQFHFIQNLISSECSSSIHTSLLHAALVEGTCSFLFHLVLLKSQQSHPIYRVPARAATVTFLTYTAGSFTGAFFNPALATATTFHCSGNSFWDYVQVYWLGPLTGMFAALLLYHGNIPRLFQKNLLYSQKSKYKIPKVKVTAHEEGDEPKKKRKGGKSNPEPRA